MAGEDRAGTSGLRIDLETGRLWLGGEAVELRPKTWSVLRHLAQRPGALVTKDELLDTVWAGAAVTEGTLNKSIGELRALLGDDREAPRFIETVPRRGFRWIGGRDCVAGGAVPAPPVDDGPAWSAAESLSGVVGREEELEVLATALSKAASGSRQVVFVAGEAGAGKSTLVEAFLATLAAGGVVAAFGQCIEALGQHEPYQPLLEAFERLARRGDVGARVASALRVHAPSWLRQMPSLDGNAADEAEDAVTPGRMLREVSSLLEEVSRERPLVLVLEDAHWADLATLDACNLVARRRDQARLLLIVTLRPADALVARHGVLALRDDLVSHGLAGEVALGLFGPEAVRAYLERRCQGLDLDMEPSLCPWIHRQTAGNPLFVRITVDELVERGILAAQPSGSWAVARSAGDLGEFVPDSLRDLVERQLDRLGATERAVVEAACVLPAEFAASTVAAVAGIAEEDAEAACEALARRGQALRRASRTRSAGEDRFAFVHSLVQRIQHERLPGRRLRRLHLAAASALAGDVAGKPESRAVRLALHYAMAGEAEKALEHLQLAADSVKSIPAPQEVVVIRERILEVVEASPHLPDHRRRLVEALMMLADARQLAVGCVDEATTTVCERILEVATTPEHVSERFRATLGLMWGRYYQGRYLDAVAIGEGLLAAAEKHGIELLAQAVQFALGSVSYRLGRFEAARGLFEACSRRVGDSSRQFGWNFQSMSLSTLALVAVHEGRPAEARRLVAEAEGVGANGGAAREASVTPLLAYALAVMGEDSAASALVERSLGVVEGIGSAAWIERARFLQGLLLARAGRTGEGVRAMKEAVARIARAGIWLEYSAYCALLADQMMRHGVPGARAFVDAGLAYRERSGESHFDAELLRLRAELGGGRDAAAEADLREAVAAARGRGARRDALSASLSLGRLLHGDGRDEEARALLEEACAGFDDEEASSIEELRVGREMLEALS